MGRERIFIQFNLARGKYIPIPYKASNWQALSKSEKIRKPGSTLFTYKK
jgi:hypothetical protein